MIQARSWRSLIVLGVTWLLPAAVFSQTESPQANSNRQPEPERVHYTVSLAGYRSHLLHIEMQLPAGEAVRTVQLPVWNAVYQIRDFAQYVNWEKAKTPAGNALPLHPVDKTTWRIDGAQEGAIVEYEVFADEGGPYGAQVNSHHAFFNLAEILMYVVGGRGWETDLTFTDIPQGWKFGTALEGENARFRASNYDRLVDSPVEIGTFDEADFDEGGAHYRVIVDAEKADYDLGRIVADLRKIVATETEWMKDRPFQTYVFLYHFTRHRGGGGMEHAYSTAIDLNPESMKNTLEVLDIVSAHEFFHLWNVKRIRPQTLEPIDYTKENYTRALWFSEGVTSAVEETIQLRAGLVNEKEYLGNISEQISELEHRPARLTQSAEASSLDAWLEGFNYYRRPERSISYYNKGELLGIMLDLAVRTASHDQASLREAMQWLNTNYAKKGRFFDDSNGVREAAEAVCHCDLSSFFAKYVAGTDELPWNDFLLYVGLRVEQLKLTVPDPGFIASRNFDSPMSVVAVTPGSEAERAGLKVGDTVTELLGKPAGEESEQRVSRLKPGDEITIKV